MGVPSLGGDVSAVLTCKVPRCWGSNLCHAARGGGQGGRGSASLVHCGHQPLCRGTAEPPGRQARAMLQTLLRAVATLLRQRKRSPSAPGAFSSSHPPTHTLGCFVPVTPAAPAASIRLLLCPTEAGWSRGSSGDARDFSHPAQRGGVRLP